uniref:Tetraspanin n=1 Tax=Myripristis murdjan TaxID=586833 RepID=A0A667XHY0_9TELE
VALNLKCTLVFLIIIFKLMRSQVSGCIILGVSIYLKVSKDENKITSQAVPGIDLMIAIGVIVMVLGFLGCCGAIKENRCMLLLFFISLLLIFILLLAAGILGAVDQNKAKELVDEHLGKLLPLNSQPADVQTDLQKLEEELKCCGLLNGPSDWGSSVPSSCDCKDTSEACMTSGSRQVYKTVSFLCVCVCVCVCIFGMAFAMTLYCQIGKKEGPTTA